MTLLQLLLHGLKLTTEHLVTKLQPFYQNKWPLKVNKYISQHHKVISKRGSVKFLTKNGKTSGTVEKPVETYAKFNPKFKLRQSHGKDRAFILQQCIGPFQLIPISSILNRLTSVAAVNKVALFTKQRSVH
ncbi:hypothetical protein AVEN_200994-1 [Araneus ventricosus]|uniref:Uncharacterized protein n=1 Tax=Araneus ventricosus TaxID=182803 RepID=A0A4Y2QPH8_ARAVE|nr:hypothetical protein AVEN_200994-1 [Araneus ventricosus]